MFCVLNNQHVVIDTFLLNASAEVAMASYIDQYDEMYPNQVERFINSEGKSINNLKPEKNWWWDATTDKFYPTKKPSDNYVYDMRTDEWIISE